MTNPDLYKIAHDISMLNFDKKNSTLRQVNLCDLSLRESFSIGCYLVGWERPCKKKMGKGYRNQDVETFLKKTIRNDANMINMHRMMRDYKSFGNKSLCQGQRLQKKNQKWIHD